MNRSIHKWRTETVHLLVLCALPKEVEHLAPPFVRGAAHLPRRARPPGGLVVEPLVVHELPDAAEPGVAARARRGLGLEAVPAAAERVQVARDARSEERRVGKECRSRWSPYH